MVVPLADLLENFLEVDLVEVLLVALVALGLLLRRRCRPLLLDLGYLRELRVG